MALNFPDSPFVGQIYSDVTAGFSYVWDGTVWKSYYQSDQTPDGTVTPPKLSPGGPVWNTSGDLNVTGILTAANISVAGTITYEDVTSVDSIGVVTARSGVVVVGGGVSVAGGGIDVNGHTETDTLRVSGVSTFQNHVNLLDGDRLYFGTDQDFFIGHETTPSPINYISGQNSVPLSIFSDNLTLGALNGENFATFTTDGSASLYYDNSKKFETLGTGVTITGQISASAGVLAGLSTFTNIRLANDAGDNTSQYVTAIGQNYVIGYNTGGGYPEDKYFQFSSGNPNFILENVGIGTTNPQYRLDVVGDINLTGTFRQNGNPFVTSRWTAGTGDNIYKLNGNVGIGTTNPTEKLQVNGNINLNYGSSTTASSITWVNSNGSALLKTFGTAVSNASMVWNTGNLISNPTSLHSVYIGSWASPNASGANNVSIGNQCGYLLSTGIGNVFVGQGAAYFTTGSNNTFIGGISGNAVTTGSNNTILGRFNGNSGGLDIRTSNNNVVIADGSGNIRLYANSSGNVGIGTTTATEKLTVRGGDISVGVSTAHGLILTSPNGTQYRLIIDDSGNLSTTAV